MECLKIELKKFIHERRTLIYRVYFIDYQLADAELYSKDEASERPVRKFYRRVHGFLQLYTLN